MIDQENLKKHKHFCYEIFKNISVWSLNGRLAYNPCSFSRGCSKITDGFNLSEVWFSDERQTIKDRVLQDEPIAGCQNCYDLESNGLRSRRQTSIDLYEQYHRDTDLFLDGPTSLDYSVGNLCNLKCMICGPGNSSSWIPDYQKIWPLEDVSQFYYEKHNQIEIDDPSVLKNIKTVHFHGGGEPLMSAAHINLLSRIEEIKGLSDVRVMYNTNGTLRVSADVLKLWEKCRLIELYFSIDDIGPRFEYQRTNASWAEVQDNLRWYYHNMPHNHMFSINCVWGYLNFYYLDEILQWHQQNFSTNRFGDPTNFIFQKALGHFGLDTISDRARNVLQSKFQKYPSLLALVDSLKTDNSNSHAEFWKHVCSIDKVRGRDFRILCPEWSELL